MRIVNKPAIILAALILTAACETMDGALHSRVGGEAMLTVEDVTITSGDVQLAATVLTPENPNGVGVVMLPGSGPAERAIIRPPADQLVKSGVTVLIFDKRGSGASSGAWQRSSLDDLARDAIAAMELLQKRPAVKGVGLWAHSQGNWVSIRAAELGAAPAFLIAVSGGGAAPRETETYNYRHRVADLAQADRQAAMAFVDAYFGYLSGAIARAELDGLIERVNDASWYARLEIERVLVSEQNRASWAWVADYDPAAFASRLNFPTFVLLGGADHTIPLELTIADWNAQLAANAVEGSRIDIFIGRDHHLRMEDAGHGHGVATDAEIWSAIDHWIASRILARKE